LDALGPQTQQAVGDMIAQNPKAKTPEIVALLAAQGVVDALAE
jgi:hypothetical protein